MSNDLAKKRGAKLLSLSRISAAQRMRELLLAGDVDTEVADSDGWTALHWAVNEGCDAAVRVLLEAGANPNASAKFGETPLHRSVFRHRQLVAEVLLAGGARVNDVDSLGKAAIHMACAAVNVPMVICLMRAGADPELKTHSGKTAWDLDPSGVTREAWVSCSLERKLGDCFGDGGAEVNSGELRVSRGLSI